MIRIARYIKPFIILILIAIVLLFVQAMADLSLPDYMSNIVNNGIQQGKHEELLARGGFYSNLYYSQFENNK